LILVSALSARLALASGSHSESTPALPGMSLMTVNGFRVELLASPQPLRLGTENKITVKVSRVGSLEPVRNGKIFMGIIPVRLLNRSQTSQKNESAASDTVDVPVSPISEQVWAGSYTLSPQFKETGHHLIRVVLGEIDGKRFDPPAVFDLHLDVVPAAGFTAGFWLLAFTAVLIVSGGMYWAVVCSRSAVKPGIAFNLLDIPWLRRFVSWRGFQPLLQIPTLVVIGVIAFLGFYDLQDGGKNLATKVTWILWWPGIIFTFILVGRLWCVMCPFGTLNEWAANLSQPHRRFPKSLRNLWLATFLFLLLTWADEQIGVIRSPQLTAWLIIVFALSAITTGVFFQRRSFCHYLCPITGLLGLYSMISPVEVRAGNRTQCQKNCDQDCYRGNEKANGCPMFEFPMTVDRNTFCNLCFECVRSCPSRNLALRFRAFGKDLWASRKRWLDESYLSVLMVGVTTLVTAQMLGEWSGLISALARLIPQSIRDLMRPVTYLTVTESATFVLGSLLLFPVLALAAAWAANRFSKDRETPVIKTFTHISYMFLPVGLAMHLAHNVCHLITEGPGIVPALQRTLSRYTFFYSGEPNWQYTPLASADAVYWLEVLLVLLGLIFSLIVGYRLATSFFDRHERAAKAFIPFALLSLIFTLINLYLLSQPMGARHGM
jgi:hypothetical protein